ncbi:MULTISPECIES: hypothetical protein [Moorena]|uniref:hypothetical protein n=1 Tax=Moorena TaxID=1155738 RepID=UPI000300C03C|nr:MULTISPECIES: hypothetical protein [Moorena]NEP68673.1 hypothetical protein [Moorena sp. SIO3A5]NER86702.1 hypothetical protein [Moorena sp. SIO3A2]NET63937.1 hypothetical protein [Moorena sp. SIO1G6]
MLNVERCSRSVAFWPRVSIQLIASDIFPIPDSRFPIPDSRFPIPDSRFPIPDSRFPIPDSHTSPSFLQISDAPF